jgi:hypothetical protein
MTSLNLTARLKKLEARSANRSNAFQRAVLVGVYENNQDEIVGAGLGEKRILRLDGEPISAMTVRAAKTLNLQVLFAICRDGSEAF